MKLRLPFVTYNYVQFLCIGNAVADWTRIELQTRQLRNFSPQFGVALVSVSANVHSAHWQCRRR